MAKEAPLSSQSNMNKKIPALSSSIAAFSKRNTRPQRKAPPKPSMEVITSDNLTWINIENPSEEEINYLAENYPFHPLDLDDTMSRRQRPKIDTYKDYLFYVLHFPKYRKDELVLSSSQVSVFIGENYLITLHSGDLKPLTKLFRECQIDEEARAEHFEFGSGYLFYNIIDRLVDYCQPIIDKMMDNLDNVEVEVFNAGTKSNQSLLKKVSYLRRDTISFRRTMWPMRALINGMEARISKYISKNMSAYFGDLIDHMDRVWDALEEVKEIAEGLFSSYSAISLDRTNDVVRVLTMLATIMMPFTVIASMWGMNVPVPWQEHPLGFVWVSVIMVIIVILLMIILRRLKII
ncbi:MAG: magnesium transporter CorA family protein [Chloroflexi bacterium]|nr:magnesium transporter CorA family protein [Chloroflexota bacterium]